MSGQRRALLPEHAVALRDAGEEARRLLRGCGGRRRVGLAAGRRDGDRDHDRDRRDAEGAEQGEAAALAGRGGGLRALGLEALGAALLAQLALGRLGLGGHLAPPEGTLDGVGGAPRRGAARAGARSGRAVSPRAGARGPGPRAGGAGAAAGRRPARGAATTRRSGGGVVPRGAARAPARPRRARRAARVRARRRRAGRRRAARSSLRRAARRRRVRRRAAPGRRRPRRRRPPRAPTGAGSRAPGPPRGGRARRRGRRRRASSTSTPATPIQPWPAASRQLSACGPQASEARAWSTPSASSGSSTSARSVSGMRCIAPGVHQRGLKRGSRIRRTLASMTRMTEHMAHIGEIDLCYEAFGSPEDPALLLVMGLGTQMIGWPDAFCEQLAGRGFHVIRYDNRDIGRSTHLRQFRPPTLRQLLVRDKSAAPLLARRHGRGRDRPARRARDRARARRRRLDGRDDRPADRGPAPGPGALARVDHVQHRAPVEGPPGAGGSTRCSPAAPPPSATRRSSRRCRRCA